MDGIAVKAGGRSFRIERVLAAGRPGGAIKDRKRGCVRIMTGAEIPRGCDSVVPVEHVVIRGDVATLKKGIDVVPGQFIHARGSDKKKGDELLQPGVVLDGPRIAVAVSAGCATIRVNRSPRIAIISTGDEVVALGERIRSFEVRRSNPYGMRAALRGWGVREIEISHVRDDRAAVRRMLKRALSWCDVLLTTGGVSEGDVDFVPSVLAELGVRKVFHKVTQRPGKPLWFGVASRRRLVFGLPGNPVSTLVCLRRYVLPALVEASGAALSGPERVTLAAKHAASNRLTLFVPVRVSQDGAGGVKADPVRYGGSGDLVALSGGDGFVELPVSRKPYKAGTQVDYFGW
jgi:molybdopterin molybdotransferase